MTLRRWKNAGRSSHEMFKRLRRERMRERWYEWAFVAAAIVGSLVAIVVFDGRTALMWSALLGVFVSVGFFGWVIGGDAHLLRWRWGAVGEEATADELEALDDSWVCEHDLPHEYGNWDHVVAGPPGVFLLETKNLSSHAVVRHDALLAGRLVFRGGGLRGAAARLGERLADGLGWRPWVQPVVVVWGQFAEGAREENGVVYVRGGDLAAWLTNQPPRLSGVRLVAARAAVGRLQEEAPPVRQQTTA
jgi:hypothetical protein